MKSMEYICSMAIWETYFSDISCSFTGLCSQLYSFAVAANLNSCQARGVVDVLIWPRDYCYLLHLADVTLLTQAITVIHIDH